MIMRLGESRWIPWWWVLIIFVGCGCHIDAQSTSSVAGTWSYTQARIIKIEPGGATREETSPGSPNIKAITVRPDGSFDWSCTMYHMYGAVERLRQCGDTVPHPDTPTRSLSLVWTDYRRNSSRAMLRDHDSAGGRTTTSIYEIVRDSSGDVWYYVHSFDQVNTAVFTARVQKTIDPSGPPNSWLGPLSIKTRGELWRVTAHVGSVVSVAYSPQGQYILTGGGDKRVCLWDAGSGKLVRNFGTRLNQVTMVAFSQDGRLAAACSHAMSDNAPPEESICIWDVSTGAEIRRIKGLKYALGIALSPTSDQLLEWGVWDNVNNPHITTAEAVAIRLWDIRTGKVITSLGYHTCVDAAAFSPDGQYVLYATFSPMLLHLWRVVDPCEVRTFGEEDGSNGCQIITMAFTHDRCWAMSGGDGSVIRVWDITTGREVRRLIGDQWSVRSLAASHFGRRLISGGADGSVCLWDVENGKKIRQFVGHTRRVCSIGFSPDDRKCVSGSDDGTLRLWSIPD